MKYSSLECFDFQYNGIDDLLVPFNVGNFMGVAVFLDDLPPVDQDICYMSNSLKLIFMRKALTSHPIILLRTLNSTVRNNKIILYENINILQDKTHINQSNIV